MEIYVDNNKTNRKKRLEMGAKDVKSNELSKEGEERDTAGRINLFLRLSP